MDIFENAAHPGVVTDVVIGNTRAAEGIEDEDGLHASESPNAR